MTVKTRNFLEFTMFGRSMAELTSGCAGRAARFIPVWRSSGDDPRVWVAPEHVNHVSSGREGECSADKRCGTLAFQDEIDWVVTVHESLDIIPRSCHRHRCAACVGTGG